MLSSSEVGDFLRSHREALTPEQVGLTRRGHRKVAGLRREEVAALAGVSTDYYTRLEQGRVLVASESVLLALAGALRLTEAEQTYLLTLARPGGHSRTAQQPQRQVVPPEVQRMMDALDNQPAFVLGRRQAVLAGNPLMFALLTDFSAMPEGERNLLRWLLLDPAARTLYLDWADIAADVTGVLRAEAAKYPDDPITARLVGELAMKSQEFRQWWADRAVRDRTTGRKRFQHPIVGRLDIEWAAFPLPNAPDQTLFIYTGPTQRDTDALRLLASWSTDRPTPQQSRAGTDLNTAEQG
jgi:transcriptional regulator with XRE-family HTH domain